MTVIERPILFNPEMAGATLEDRKTQTRRVIKPQPRHLSPVRPYHLPDGRWKFVLETGMGDGTSSGFRCPYGQPGDQLWVRETHYRFGIWVKNGKTKAGRQKWTFKPLKDRVLFTDGPPMLWRKNSYRKAGWYKRPSIFMPRAHSRIQLRVTDVAVHQLRDMGVAEMRAEGITAQDLIDDGRANPGRGADMVVRLRWIELWNCINEGRGYGWSENPWVWAVTFERIKP